MEVCADDDIPAGVEEKNCRREIDLERGQGDRSEVAQEKRMQWPMGNV